MCGIVGYVGARPALDILMGGLARLEYRGYDSAGVAVHHRDSISVVRNAGRVADLALTLAAKPPATASTGVGHTRWATHGAPNTKNAHPHRDCTGRVIVVHNGIIENWIELRAELAAKGHAFASDTDTEVLAHLIEEGADGPLADAVRAVLHRAEGSLAIAVMRAGDPSLIVGARRGSPLVVGIGDGENFVASDIPAFLEHTRRMMVVDDDRVVELRPECVVVTDPEGTVINPEERTIVWDLEAAEKGGYATFMLKEINEQPQAIADTIRGRIAPDGTVNLSELVISQENLRRVDKVFVVACGTSYHAAMMGKYAIERWTRLPVEIDIGSEFRYRDPVLDENTLVIGISQSGETADTLAAVRHAREQGSMVIGLCNVVDSSLARESDAVLYTRAGPEIGVAATKTFTTQLVAVQMLGLWLAKALGTLEAAEAIGLVQAIRRLPDQVQRVLERQMEVEALSQKWVDTRDFFFLGRSGDFPVAMEGALKLKEIAYVRAEGYAAGEMKHGPIALIEPGVVVVGVATDRRVRSKIFSNIQEMRARDGTILMVVEEGEEQAAAELAHHLLVIPEAPDLLCTVTAVVPLQLLAYFIATARGLDVDKPRNLAKTVTVE